MKADRRLYVTADRSAIVEENDPRSAFLLRAAGRPLQRGQIEQYKLELDEYGRVTYPGCRLPPPPEPDDLVGADGEDVSSPEAEASAEEDGGEEDGGEEDGGEELPEWPLDMGPEEYLKRFPNAKNSELARRHIAAAAG